MVLVPVVLIVALGIAALLIWAGIKLAPVSLRDPEAYLANQQTQSGKNYSGTAENNNQNNNQNNSGSNPSISDYLNQPGASVTPDAGGSGTVPDITSGSDNASLQAQNKNIGNSGSSPVNNNNQNFSSSGSSGTVETTETEPGKSGSSAADTANSRTDTSDSSGCTYPSGNLDSWWHTASQKQRDCYISKMGQPRFDSSAPYFCDYNNSQDCYYR